MHHDTIKLRTIKPESQHHHKLIQAAQYLHEQTDATVTLAQLAKVVDLSPSNLRRGFLNAYGVTPRAYQANARRQAFREALRQGANVTQATYDAGYGSSSRVVDPSGANLGMPPGNFDKGHQTSISAGSLVTASMARCCWPPQNAGFVAFNLRTILRV